MRFLRISSAQGLNHSSIVFGKQKLIKLASSRVRRSKTVWVVKAQDRVL